jgi:hypothetical protein
MIFLAIRFLAELAGVAALAVIGATVPDATAARIALGVGLPLALIVVWGLVAAPKARNGLSQRTRQLIGTALLAGVGVALALAGHPGWGIGLAVIVVADQALVLALGLDDPTAAFNSTASHGGH